MRKIAIIGHGPSKKQFDFNSDYEVWSLNQKIDLPRFDLWFDIHNLSRINKDSGYWQFLKENETKIIICEENKALLPNAQIYPKELIENMYFSRLFHCSISWMIAYAVFQGVKEIALYGVDMLLKTEYQEQRPSVLYWLGVAQGLGINIVLPENSALLNGKYYWNL